MFFPPKISLYLISLYFILIVSINNLVAMDGAQDVEMKDLQTKLPEINRSRSTSPRRKINATKLDYFTNLDRELKQDLELVDFIAMPADKTDDGPLQYIFNLFANNYLLNTLKINAVYEVIDEILKLKHSMIFEKKYTCYPGSIQNQIAILTEISDVRLISLLHLIENNLIFNKNIHEGLLLAAKDYLIEQVKNWQAQQFNGKELAKRLLFFSGEGYKNAIQNIIALSPGNEEIALRIFAISEVVNFSVILFDLFNDVRVRSTTRSISPDIVY